MTSFTRVGFCQECKDNHRPKSGNLFVALGASGNYHIYVAGSKNTEGYVPHIYIIDKVLDGNVIYHKICCMHNCGISTVNKISNKFSFDERAWSKHILPIKEWNALQQFRNTGYEI